MRKLFYVFGVLILLASCASVPGRVCGGKGGGRCVDNTSTTIYNQPIA